MPINYELAKRESPSIKAELTRAKKRGYPAVLAACKHAIARWEVWGAWPDQWHRWQIALDDAAHKQNMAGGEYVIAPRLESLQWE